MPGMMFRLERVQVDLAEFERTEPEFPEYVVNSWMNKFDVDGNSYALIIDECKIEKWMIEDSLKCYPLIDEIETFFLVKFDNVINKIIGSDYKKTPRNDENRRRLSENGLSMLFSYVATAVETFGACRNVSMFAACAYDRALERYYRYLLTHGAIAGYYIKEFIPANGQTHFAFFKRQG